MTVQWWQEQEELLLQKVVQHERDVRHVASQLQEQIQAKANAEALDSQKEYWRKDLDLREKTSCLNGKESKRL